MQSARPPWLAALAGRVQALAEAERGRFAPFLAVALAAGAALYYVLPAEPAWRTGPSLVSSGLVLLLVGRQYRAILALGLLVAAAGIGFTAAQWATARMPPQSDLPTRATIVTGTVAMVEPLPQGQRVTLAEPRLDQAPPLPRSLRIRLRPGDPVPVATGDTLRVRAMLLPPSGAPLPGGWDIQFDAFFTGGAGFGYALNPAERLAAAPPGGIAARMQALQEAIMRRIHAALPGRIGRLAAGLMVGGTTAIAPEDQAAFRNSGIYHLLSISGLHLAIAMGLVFAGIRLLLAAIEWTALRLPTKAIAAVGALVAGGFYTMLTGSQVPMLRSFAAACLVTLAILVGRRALSLRAWALALAAVLLAAPYEVVRVSFQMSFAATLALIAGFEALRPWLTRVAGQGSVHGTGRMRRALAWLAALALTSALAGTAAAPFGAYHFGAVQIYYVLANMAAVPLTSVLVMPAAVAALLLMPLGLEQLALVPMGWGVRGLLAIGEAVSAWPQAVVAVPHIAPWGLAAYGMGLAWLALWRTRLRLAGLVAIAAGLLSAVLDRPPDLLVSADARLIGLRAGDVLYVERAGNAGAFVLEYWRQRLGLHAIRPMPPAGAASPDGAVACAATACTLRPRAGGPAALLLRGPPGDAACTAALVVSAEPLRLDCPSVPRIDRFSVWRQGAHAAWLDPSGVRIATDRTTRGDRPWVTPLPTRTRQPPGPLLPPAQADSPHATSRPD